MLLFVVVLAAEKDVYNSFLQHIKYSVGNKNYIHSSRKLHVKKLQTCYVISIIYG